MGEMADFALDAASMELDHYYRYKDASLTTQYEEGIVDEYGVTVGNPRSIAIASSCPKCGSSMSMKTGQYGSFMGCSRFPKCNGSRSA